MSLIIITSTVSKCLKRTTHYLGNKREFNVSTFQRRAFRRELANSILSLR